MLFAFDESTLRELAGDTVFARGGQYHRDGAVGKITVRAGMYCAEVIGSEAYRTRLGWQDGLDGDCDCPAAEDGFCKHQVALGLAVLAGEVAHAGKASPRTRRSQTHDDAAVDDDSLVARWLSGLPPARLAELVIRNAATDPDRWRALVAQAKAATASPGAARDAVKTLIGSPRFLDWRRSREYARRLEALFDIFDSQSGDPARSLPLMLFALKKLLSVYTKIDDSSGSVGDVGARVGARILETARAFTAPEPALAKDVFAVLSIDDWDSLQPLAQLAPALGPKGMADLQKMAEKRLSSLPVPKERWDPADGDHRHALRVLEQVLEAQGDIDALIDLKKRSLDTGYDHLQLAELCLSHGRTREGIEWLERGVKQAPDEFRLHDRLAEARVAEGFAEEAIELLLGAFRQRRTLERYAALKRVATAAGDWPALRARIDEDIAASGAIAPDMRLHLRIELRLADGDEEGAWALATGQRLPLHLWRKLLPMLERTRPLEATRVLKTLVDAALEQAHNSRYEEAVALMLRMVQVAHAHSEVVGKVDDYLTEWRTLHARRSKLIAMMAGVSTTPSANVAPPPRKRGR